MKKIQAFLILGSVIMFLLCIGIFIEKENEKGKRIGAEEMLVSSIEENARLETALKEEIREREKRIKDLFARLEKERKRNAVLIANIKRRNSRLSLASQDKREVELQKIVVTSLQELEGKVLAVDSQSNLIVINLGTVNSVKMGDRFSVYRGSEFITNIELIKIQGQLSAGAILSEERGVKVAVNDLVRRF